MRHLDTFCSSGGYNLTVKCLIVHLTLIKSWSPSPRDLSCRCGGCLTTSLLWPCLADKPGSVLFAEYLQKVIEFQFMVGLLCYFRVRFQLSQLGHCGLFSHTCSFFVYLLHCYQYGHLHSLRALVPYNFFHIFATQLTSTLSNLFFPSSFRVTFSTLLLFLYHCPPSSKHRKPVLETPACVSLHFKVRVSSWKINTGQKE